MYMKVFLPTIEEILTMTHEQWLIVDEEELDAKFEAMQKKPVQAPAPVAPINLHAANQSENYPTLKRQMAVLPLTRNFF